MNTVSKKSTFYRHYQQFFNPVSKRWDQEQTGDAVNDQAGHVVDDVDLQGKLY